MTQDEKKDRVARAALELVEPSMVVGVGTGSTADRFIDALSGISHRIDGAVASSERTAARLVDCGVRVLDLNDVDELPLYVDGADEANRLFQLVKGGGGALTREKIVAAVATRFVCIIDDSKRVERLGAFPLPVEVIPMARAYVARRLVALGGRPEWREDLVTDNGNVVLYVQGLEIDDAIALEDEIGRIAGVVTCGLFARRPADDLLIGGDDGVTHSSR